MNTNASPASETSTTQGHDPFWRVSEELMGQSSNYVLDCLRAIDRWTRASPGERQSLARAGECRASERAAEEVPEEARSVCSRLQSAPGELTTEEVLLCARSLARWALDQGAGATARAFSEQALRMHSDDAEALILEGEAWYTTAHYEEALRSFRVALALSKQAQRKDIRSRASAGIAKALMEKGQLGDAAEDGSRAAELAEAVGDEHLWAHAAHVQLQIALMADRVDETTELALRILGSFRRREEAAHLAAAMVHAWILRGHPEKAIGLCDMALEVMRNLRQRILTTARGARAAAMLGDEAGWRVRADRTRLLVSTLPPTAHTAQCWYNLAIGAATVDEREECADCAARAFDLAEANKQQQLKKRARAWVAWAREGAALPATSDLGRRENADPWTDRDGELARRFMERLATAL